MTIKQPLDIEGIWYYSYYSYGREAGGTVGYLTTNNDEP
jgi:hypothetical protein